MQLVSYWVAHEALLDEVKEAVRSAGLHRSLFSSTTFKGQGGVVILEQYRPGLFDVLLSGTGEESELEVKLYVQSGAPPTEFNHAAQALQSYFDTKGISDTAQHN